MGRTARAGARGEAYTLLRPGQYWQFRKLRRSLDRKEVKKLEVTDALYAPLLPQYALVLKDLEVELRVRVWWMGMV